MYCRKCGSELAENARFCSKCGTAVEGVQQKRVQARRPAPAMRPVSAGEYDSGAGYASASKADKIDLKLIAAVTVFLVLQLAAVILFVPSADTGSGAPAESIVVADGGEENGQAKSYFGKEIRVGGKVELGRYEQDGDTRNGPEPIEWDVVESFEDGYLLVSRYILDGMPWDDGSGNGSTLDLKTEITYEQCSMRRWIRDSFAAEAFTDEELSLIIPVSVKGDDILAQKNNQYATDYAFILREDEVEDYWGDAAPDKANASLVCAPTEYAAWSGLAVETDSGVPRHRYNDSTNTAVWALRRRYTDPKAKKPKIVTVDTRGRFSNGVVTETLGFRPAIYVIYK